ncbi:hypothetical protein NQ317_007194 [Molorchus minor]|uniref:Uncharacterized protein n=1 Tax=Molorchus minor TaxID=1323400 RepID=A0ABQ9J5U5_9CUCU|nr:hypothetical protein NQ317_007194 [Molorchus minor]
MRIFPYLPCFPAAIYPLDYSPYLLILSLVSRFHAIFNEDPLISSLEFISPLDILISALDFSISPFLDSWIYPFLAWVSPQLTRGGLAKGGQL